MNSPNPREDRFAAILRMYWTIIESKTISKISQRIRSRVDVSQIVNDAAKEWMEVVSVMESEVANETLSDERLIGLLRRIVDKRTLDAIRSENTWKRGGQLEAFGSEHLQQCTDPHCSDCLSEMQSEEMRSLLDIHLDSMQQQVLELRCYGYSEIEIAERMRITLASVQRIRKSIAAVAKAINLTRDERRETRDERRETRDEKIVSENGNFPAGTGADYDW
jgi:DNA-binding CsgD family transcriptional regulator